MKKLIIVSLLLFTTQGIFAQLDWSKLQKEYSELFILAERVAEQTSKVTADENGIGFEVDGKTLSFERVIDLKATKEHFKYNLIKSDGTKIPLDKVLTEKVILKYTTLLNKVNENLKVDRGAQVEELLNGLFSN